MEFFREYALLIAVATPVLVIAGLQAYLFLAGESGTLLLPSLKPFPSVAIEPEPEAAAPAMIETEARTVAAASNDHHDQLAA
jgi:hypothetical protein